MVISQAGTNRSATATLTRNNRVFDTTKISVKVQQYDSSAKKMGGEKKGHITERLQCLMGPPWYEATSGKKKNKLAFN